MKTYFLTFILIIGMSLQGCSIFNLQQDSSVLKAQLDQIQSWQVRGKLSVIDKQQAVTGYLTWRQDDDNYDLFLSGPFGQGSSHLIGNSQYASLSMGGEDAVLADTAEQLMQQHMGWQFPVLDLRYWVKGQASPNSSATEVRDPIGLLESLQQHGWQVQFSRYQRQGNTWLPGRIKIKGHQLKFIFVIKEWTILG
jgi:outer membrane lipoprotein LolB